MNLPVRLLHDNLFRGSGQVRVARGRHVQEAFFRDDGRVCFVSGVVSFDPHNGRDLDALPRVATVVRCGYGVAVLSLFSSSFSGCEKVLRAVFVKRRPYHQFYGCSSNEATVFSNATVLNGRSDTFVRWRRDHFELYMGDRRCFHRIGRTTYGEVQSGTASGGQFVRSFHDWAIYLRVLQGADCVRYEGFRSSSLFVVARRTPCGVKCFVLAGLGLYAGDFHLCHRIRGSHADYQLQVIRVWDFGYLGVGFAVNCYVRGSFV